MPAVGTVESLENLRCWQYRLFRPCFSRAYDSLRGSSRRRSWASRCKRLSSCKFLLNCGKLFFYIATKEKAKEVGEKAFKRSFPCTFFAHSLIHQGLTFFFNSLARRRIKRLRCIGIKFSMNLLKYLEHSTFLCWILCRCQLPVGFYF